MERKVVLVGRPNVGKSSLFNRLVGQTHALVHPTPGMTRDYRQAPCILSDIPFDIIDTGGVEGEWSGSTMGARIWQQTQVILQEASLVLFVIDAQDGVTPLDEEFANYLRRLSKPVWIVANKSESKKTHLIGSEAWSLGFGAPRHVSASHGTGIGELLVEVERYLAKEVPLLETPTEDEAPFLHLAIVGRPNAGKSTLFNALLKEERSLTGPEAGLTRDAIAATLLFKDKIIKLVDTAGMRRHSKITGDLEKMAIQDARRAIKYANVVALVLDAQEPLTDQDLAIASHVIDEGRALVIALNKWDLITDKEERLKDIKNSLKSVLSQVQDVPFVSISALKKLRLESLLTKCFEIYEVWGTRLTTARLNEWLSEIQQRHPAPLVKGIRVKIRYMTQIKTRPPTFALFLNKPQDLPDSYVRYLQNELRACFSLQGVTMRFLLRKGENPYAKSK